jgi:hypothetical protein
VPSSISFEHRQGDKQNIALTLSQMAKRCGFSADRDISAVSDLRSAHPPRGRGAGPQYWQRRDGAQVDITVAGLGPRSCAMEVIFMAQQWRKRFCAMMKVALREKAWRKPCAHACS